LVGKLVRGVSRYRRNRAELRGLTLAMPIGEAASAVVGAGAMSAGVMVAKGSVFDEMRKGGLLDRSTTEQVEPSSTVAVAM
jgi:hypothetical protein